MFYQDNQLTVMCHQCNKPVDHIEMNLSLEDAIENRGYRYQIFCHGQVQQAFIDNADIQHYYSSMSKNYEFTAFKLDPDASIGDLSYLNPFRASELRKARIQRKDEPAGLNDFARAYGSGPEEHELKNGAKVYSTLAPKDMYQSKYKNLYTDKIGIVAVNENHAKRLRRFLDEDRYHVFGIHSQVCGLRFHKLVITEGLQRQLRHARMPMNVSKRMEDRIQELRTRLTKDGELIYE